MVNMRPIWCVLDGQTHWPAIEGIFSKKINPRYVELDEQNKWQMLPASERVMPLVPFNASTTSNDHGLPPGSVRNGVRHWLGTDEYGRDVLAGLITGAQTSLFIAVLTLLVALIIGGLMGGLAGYLGDDRLKTTTTGLFCVGTAFFTGIFLLFFSRKSQLTGVEWYWGMAIIMGLSGVTYGLLRLFKKFNIGQKQRTIPVDMLIMRLAELFESVPAIILLLLSVTFIQERTLFKIIVLIGFLFWTGTARFLRAELKKVREMDYIRAVRRLGIPEWRIFWKHALPNAIRPVLLLLALSASSAILVESALSFLNLGSNNTTEVTWGKMLQTARQNIELWWVWVPPGIMIALFSAALFEWNESKFA